MQPSFIIEIHLSPWSTSSLDRLIKGCKRHISCCSFVPRCLTVLLRKCVCCQTPWKVNINVCSLVPCDVWCHEEEKSCEVMENPDHLHYTSSTAYYKSYLGTRDVGLIWNHMLGGNSDRGISGFLLPGYLNKFDLKLVFWNDFFS